MTRIGRALAVSAAICSFACEHHVQLRFPNSSPGEEYSCAVTTSQVESCKPATKLDPAERNKAGTVYVIVPRECQGHFNEITIHDSGSSHPTVEVLCSPPENRIQ